MIVEYCKSRSPIQTVMEGLRPSLLLLCNERADCSSELNSDLKGPCWVEELQSLKCAGSIPVHVACLQTQTGSCLLKRLGSFACSHGFDLDHTTHKYCNLQWHNTMWQFHCDVFQHFKAKSNSCHVWFPPKSLQIRSPWGFMSATGAESFLWVLIAEAVMCLRSHFVTILIKMILFCQWLKQDVICLKSASRVFLHMCIFPLFTFTHCTAESVLFSY